jgi:hypothetical protein
MFSWWSIVKVPVGAFVLGFQMIVVALLLLSEYRRLLMTDRKLALTADSWMKAIVCSGKRGCIAAVLAGAALMCFAYAAFSLVFKVGFVIPLL